MIDIVKVVFFDVIKLYKNFFHWVFSKITISGVRYLLSIMFAAPFFIAFLIVLFWLIDWRYLVTALSSGSIWSDFLIFLYSNIFVVILLVILMFFVLLAFMVWYSYWTLLLLNLNINYLNWNKLSFWNKSYFDFFMIFKYVKILWFTILYLLIPVAVFLVVFIALFFIFWWFWELSGQLWDNTSIFWIVTFILLGIWLLSSIYLMYRLSFSYIILLDKDNYSDDNVARFYPKESLKLTSSFTTLSKLFFIVLLFSLVIVPFTIKNNTIDVEYNNMRDYLLYEQSVKEWKIIGDNDLYAYNSLKLEYSSLSLDDLENRIDKYSIYQTLFFVFHYLFIYWIFEMVFVSFYKNELMKNNNSTKTEKWFIKKMFTKNKKK